MRLQKYLKIQTSCTPLLLSLVSHSYPGEEVEQVHVSKSIWMAMNAIFYRAIQEDIYHLFT